jgi:hypothetical protein
VLAAGYLALWRQMAVKRDLPDTFYLMLKPDLIKWCEILWRGNSEVGVKFFAGPAAKEDVRRS